MDVFLSSHPAFPGSILQSEGAPLPGRGAPRQPVKKASQMSARRRHGSDQPPKAALRESQFRARRREIRSNHFPWRPVRQGKYFSARKCASCPSQTDKECAQRAASPPGGKSPQGFFDSLLRGPSARQRGPSLCIHVFVSMSCGTVAQAIPHTTPCPPPRGAGRRSVPVDRGTSAVQVDRLASEADPVLRGRRTADREEAL